jgi:hypothetical protein
MYLFLGKCYLMQIGKQATFSRAIDFMYMYMLFGGLKRSKRSGSAHFATPTKTLGLGGCIELKFQMTILTKIKS